MICENEKKQKNWKVVVRCFTYNQSKYIADAMNSFSCQKTNFPYVCCIVDDASTDGEKKKIKDYISENFDLSNAVEAYNKETDFGEIIFAQHKINKNCHFVALLLKKNHYSEKMRPQKLQYLAEWRNSCEYEAVCEGDDWWLDEYKLQKQVDVLDANPQLDMCACGTIRYMNGNVNGGMMPSKTKKILTTAEAIVGGGDFLGTNTLMYRISLMQRKMAFYEFFPYDYTLQILGSLRGGIYYIPDNMAAYRFCSENSWTVSMKKNKRGMLCHWIKILRCLKLLDKDTEFKYRRIITKRRWKIKITCFKMCLKNCFCRGFLQTLFA